MIVRPFLVVASLGLLAATALAEQPEKHAITLRETWKVGDAYTRTVDETESVRWKVVADGEVRQETAQDRRVTYHAVGVVLEVDAAGHATKSVLYFVAWSQEGRGARDGSLSGAHVELTGRGNARASRIVASSELVTEAARRWLDERFGTPRRAVDLGGRDPDDVYEPPLPLAVGDTWEPDAAVLAKIASASVPVIADKVVAAGKLEAVEDGMARLRVAVRLPLRGLQTSESSPLLAWKRGGILETTLHSTRPTAGGFAGALTRESHLEGVADAQGADVEFDMSVRTEVRVEAGGRMPRLPEAAPAPDAPTGPDAPKAPDAPKTLPGK